MPVYGKKRLILAHDPVEKPMLPGDSKQEDLKSSPMAISVSSFYDDKDDDATHFIHAHAESTVPSLEESTVGSVSSGHLGHPLSRSTSGHAQALDSISPMTSTEDFLQLPQLKFDEDHEWDEHTWMLGGGPAAPMSDQKTRSETSFYIDSYPPGIPRTVSRPDSTPPLPRRSSKRNQAVTQKQLQRRLSKSMDLTHHRTSTSKTWIEPQLDGAASSISADHGTEVSKKVEEMLTATRNLKPVLDVVSQAESLDTHDDTKGWLTSRFGKLKRRTRAFNTADTSSLRSASEKETAVIRKVNSVELRRNEDSNLVKSRKVLQLTGQGSSERSSSVQSDRSVCLTPAPELESMEDPFVEDALAPTTGTLTRSASLRSLDPSSRRPNRSHVIGDLLRHLSGNRSAATQEGDGPVDLEALLAASPSHQPTTRIRLEPTHSSDGRRRLRNVPASTRSLFDPTVTTIIEANPTVIQDECDGSSRMTPLRYNSPSRKGHGDGNFAPPTSQFVVRRTIALETTTSPGDIRRFVLGNRDENREVMDNIIFPLEGPFAREVRDEALLPAPLRPNKANRLLKTPAHPYPQRIRHDLGDIDEPQVDSTTCLV